MEDVAGRGVAAEIDGIARRREDRLTEFLLELGIGPLDERDAIAAGDMVEPDLAGAEAALGGEMLARGDELAVRAPGRIVEEGEAFLGQLAFAGTVRVHDPDIVAAAAIRGEGDLASVGREAGVGFEC